MEFTAKQIADFINGKVEGDANAAVNTFAKIEEGVPGALSFLSNPKYTHYIYIGKADWCIRPKYSTKRQKNSPLSTGTTAGNN